MKKIFTIQVLLLLLIMVLVAACDPTRDAPLREDSDTDGSAITSDSERGEESDSTKGGIVMLNETNACWHGRVYTSGRATMCNWTASGFSITFQGSQIDCSFITSATGKENGPFIQVLLDGSDEGEKLQITSPGFYTLAKDLPEGEHTLRVVKLTENAASSLGVLSLRFPKGGEVLDPPPKKERKIQFIGDSITCGHSNIRTTEADPYLMETQDGWQTYAAITARNVQADFQCFSISGGRVTAIEESPNLVIPALYKQTDPLRAPEEMWDFSGFVPDVVVVALGTNDSDYILSGGQESFKEQYIAFLRELRTLHPQAKIVCTLGMMSVTAIPYIEEAIDEIGDSHIYSLHEEKAGNTHPRLEAHQRTAVQLTQLIRDITNWD